MKKLVFAAALALCAVANAEIASSTTVGYTTKTLEAGKWYLVGAGFEGVGTELTVQNFVSGLTASDNMQTAPTIQYWDGAKLVTLYYITGAFDGTGFVTAWADSGTIASTLSVNPGWGCWIKVPTETKITISGQVVSAATKDLEVTSSWQLAGNPFPVATSVNSNTMDCTGLVASGEMQTAPTIQYWDLDNAKLVTLYYITGAFDGTGFVTAWADSSTMASTLALDPCTGFWVKSPTGGKITWKK